MSTKKELRELNVVDVVKDIANRLQVTYKEENNEICMDIPEEAGSGHIKAINFSHGVGVMDVDITLKKEVRFVLNQSLVQPLQIVFICCPHIYWSYAALTYTGNILPSHIVVMCCSHM